MCIPDPYEIYNLYNPYRTISNTTYDTFEPIKYVQKLLYKGWITIRQWLMQLHIINIYRKIKPITGYKKNLLNRKTCKSTTPIRRYRPHGRS